MPIQQWPYIRPLNLGAEDGIGRVMPGGGGVLQERGVGQRF